jgi:hypothetical protein
MMNLTNKKSLATVSEDLAPAVGARYGETLGSSVRNAVRKAVRNG